MGEYKNQFMKKKYSLLDPTHGIGIEAGKLSASRGAEGIAIFGMNVLVRSL